MKKLKQNKGFTLVEMLACIVTLILICMICSTGMNLALRSFQRSVFESDSQMLESTLNMSLSDMLRHATDIKTENGVLVFTNTSYGLYDGTIDLSTDKYLVYTNEGGTGSMILSKDAYSETLYIDTITLVYDKNTEVFTGGYTIKSTLLNDLQRHVDFTCRNIAE